ncbi:MAG: type III pantothenate kinase, partial [Sediminibacterium sp.]
MSTSICFDFGNTRLKAAIFLNKELQKVHVFEQASIENIQALILEWKPEKTILASVIHHDKEIEALLAKNSKFHLLGPNTKINFTTPVGKPETIGADRIALITAAVDQYPDQHNLVISLGSCITYNFVNRQHEFLGGSISPGMQMRFKSMHDLTALLPMVEASSEFPLVGYDTKTNLLSGVILGIAAEIDGIITAYEQKYANFNVLLTGGDICYFAPHLKKRIFADQN